MVRDPPCWFSFARMVGEDYESALRDQRELEAKRAAEALVSGRPYQPASENEIRTRAALYAIGTGLANAAVEVSGGLETLPGELKGGGGAWAALRDSMAHEGGEEVIQGSLGRGLKNAVYDAGAPVFSVRDENAIFNPVTAMKEFAGGAAVGGILGGAQMGIGRAAERIGSSVFAADTLGIVDPAVAQDAGQRLAEITATPGRGHGNETMSGENTARSTSGPIQVGRVTTIKHPYQGPKPIQAPKADTTIQVNSDSVERTRSQINVAQEMAQAPLEKRRFKTILTELLEKTFHRAQGVEVEGVTFGGKPYLVDINQNIPGKVVSDPNLTAEKLTLLDILPEVVKQGEYVGSGEYVQHGDKKKLTIRFDYFETLVTIGEKPYIASFDVEVFPNTNNYRTHKLNEIELSPATNADPGPVPGASATETALAEDAHFLNLDSTITGPANVVKSGLGLQIDATDLVKLYQQLLTEASTAKRIETLAEYYRKYVGDPSGRGAKGVDSAAFQELEKAYREAMGLGQYDDETFQELKQLYELYLGDPMEDED